MLARLPSGVELIPIQNGFDQQLDAFGHEWEGIASFVSERLRTGRTRESRERGNCMSGEETPPPLPPWQGERTPSPDRGGWTGSCFFRLVEVSDINPIKHTKLMYNAAISPLAAAAGIDNGKLLSLPERVRCSSRSFKRTTAS